MRSFTIASIFALALSVSAIQSTPLDKRYDTMETIESVDSGYPTDALEKRHYHEKHSNLVAVGYKCESTTYSLKRVEKAKQKACRKIDSFKLIKRKYPKIYEPKNSSAEFRDVKGNKYMFPMLRKGIYSRARSAGHHRVIVSKNSKECELAGLVVQRKVFKGLLRRTRFTKCTKVYEKTPSY